MIVTGLQIISAGFFIIGWAGKRDAMGATALVLALFAIILVPDAEGRIALGAGSEGRSGTRARATSGWRAAQDVRKNRRLSDAFPEANISSKATPVRLRLAVRLGIISATPYTMDEAPYNDKRTRSGRVCSVTGRRSANGDISMRPLRIKTTPATWLTLYADIDPSANGAQRPTATPTAVVRNSPIRTLRRLRATIASHFIADVMAIPAG